MQSDLKYDISEAVWKSLKANEQWMNKNGYVGYDPHDIKGIGLFIYLLKPGHGILVKIIRRILITLINYFPLTLRKLLKIPKTTNAKGMALFAKAYLNLYKVTKREEYKNKAIYCLDWLIINKSEGYKNNAWGYPFDWQSGEFTPAGTPACVVCSAVADAFWEAYILFNEKKYIDVCEGICKFFIEDLNIDNVGDNCICFSYTPIDHLHVHNANLMVAEHLIRIGKYIGNEMFVDFGMKAVNYALNEQQNDGSIFYWGNDQQFNSPGAIDHYHTGFEIRSLFLIASHTNDERVVKAYNRYYDFYLKHFLYEIESDKLMPKMTPKSYYPVNVHSCAEAIILNAKLVSSRNEASVILDKLCPTIINQMQNSDGSFYYMRRKLFGIELVDKIPYIRWGQAWMYLALSEYLVTVENNK